MGYPTLCDLMGCSPPGCFVRGDNPGKNTGMGCHGLLQGIFSTQVSNPGLLHCRQILYHHEKVKLWSSAMVGEGILESNCCLFRLSARPSFFCSHSLTFMGIFVLLPEPFWGTVTCYLASCTSGSDFSSFGLLYYQSFICFFLSTVLLLLPPFLLSLRVLAFFKTPFLSS